MAKKAVEGEIVAKSAKKTKTREPYVFRPMAGFFLLYSLAFMGLIFTLDGNDYNSVLERTFWAVITIGLAVGIYRHWPAMWALIIGRGKK